MNFDELAKQIHAATKAAGWWEGDQDCVYTKLQLVSTEIAEATEGERKNLMDDHLPHRKMGEVELADALIRVLDLGGRFGWKYKNSLNPPKFLSSVVSKKPVAVQHLFINRRLVQLLGVLLADRGNHSWLNHHYTQLVNTILFVGGSQGYDIESAMHEKLEYNKQRADHKLENRAKKHGKAF